jgi:hypothetical protein
MYNLRTCHAVITNDIKINLKDIGWENIDWINPA